VFSETNFVSVRGRYLTLYLAAAMMNADSARRDADPRVVAESALRQMNLNRIIQTNPISRRR